MSLMTTIQNDLLALRKQATDKASISSLTTLYSEAANIGINAGKRETTDEEVIALIKKFIKNIDECLEHAKDKLPFLAEKALLEKYMPSQMTEEQMRTAINIFVTANGQTSKADIMKYLKSAFAGKYDGRMAATIADSFIKP